MEYSRKTKKSKKWILWVAIIGFAGYWFLFRPPDIPNPISPVPEATVQEVLASNDKIFIDTRSPEKYNTGTIRRAVNVTDNDFNRGYLRLMSELIVSYDVFVFGEKDSLDAQNVTRRLEGRGVKNLYFVPEGFEALQAAGAK